MITAIFDTETTGLLLPSANSVDEQPEICELYVVKLDTSGDPWTFEGEFESFIRTKLPIPADTTAIHGITNEMVADAPAFEDIVDELSEFMTGVEVLVAHNLPFDRSMLANELIRCDRLIQFPWPRKHICTVEMAMPIEQRRMTLSNLHTYATGAPHQNAHRAKDDVAALVRCYNWLCEREAKRNGG